MRRSSHPSSAPHAAMPSPRGSAAVALLAALATAFAALLLTAAPASAHNALRSSDPADGATVESAPAQVTLTFDQSALALGTEVVVTAADGTAVSAGAVQLTGTSVVQPLAEDRPAGAYRVDWRVTSADGHPISGSFGFTATAATGPAAAAAAAPAEETVEPTTAPTEDAAPEQDEPTAQAAGTDDAAGGAADEAGTDGGPGRGGPWLPVLLLVLVIAGLLTFATLRQRRRRASREDTDGRDGAGPSDPGPTAG